MNRFLCVFLSICVFLSLCTSPALALSSGDGDWQTAYLNYIRKDLTDTWGSANTDEPKRFTEYHLFDLNGDGVPELWINYNITAYGGKLCSYSGGQVHAVSTNVSSLRYLAGENLVLDSGGYMDMSHDTIFQLENGQFTQVAKGVCTVTYRNGTPQSYEYTWNETAVDAATYEQKLNAAFDVSQAVTLEEAMTYQEVLTAIDQWSAPASTSLSLRPMEPTALAEALVTVHWGGLVTEDAVTTFHPGGSMTQAIPVTVLGLLGGLTASQPEEETPVQSPSHPRPSYLADYLGMTQAQIAEIWGSDYIAIEGGSMGADSYLYYEDFRVPAEFDFYQNVVTTVTTYPHAETANPTPLADRFTGQETYSQLLQLGLPDTLITADNDPDNSLGWNFAETAAYYYDYNGKTFYFSWLDEDPYTSPANFIIIWGT